MAGEFGVLVLYVYFTPDRLKGHPSSVEARLR